MSEIDSAILDELKARQPIFHHRELVHSAETFEGKAHPDFWEVGASGTVYSREEARATILRRLDERTVDEMDDDGWVTEQHRLIRPGEDTYLLTYILHGQGRATRWATIWPRSAGNGWRAVYHQGTVVRESR